MVSRNFFSCHASRTFFFFFLKLSTPSEFTCLRCFEVPFLKRVLWVSPNRANYRNWKLNSSCTALNLNSSSHRIFLFFFSWNMDSSSAHMRFFFSFFFFSWSLKNCCIAVSCCCCGGGGHFDREAFGASSFGIPFNPIFNSFQSVWGREECNAEDKGLYSRQAAHYLSASYGSCTNSIWLIYFEERENGPFRNNSGDNSQ